jgi:transcriptional regulator with GAF, ATPase, and Fis domain
MSEMTNKIEGWCHFCIRDHAAYQDSISASLARAGLILHPVDLSTPQGSGMIFFDEVNQSLYDFIGEASRSSSSHILAIATDHSVLVEETYWRLLQAGAADVFAWNHSVEPSREIAARFKRWEEVDALMGSPLVQNNIVGQSPAWTNLLRQIVEVARYTDVSILITGESGTGKELMARLIHTLDARPNKRNLVVVDCTTIVPDLSGSEFFGHERGAFTSAVAARDGAFMLAHEGTLFLDEVGELPPGLQAELLRVVQERTYKRVGSNTWNKTNFRLVCATNRDLHQSMAQGDFRQDFYYRIAAWTCKLPSLGERPEDILPLAYHFMQQLRPDQEPLTLDGPVLTYLLKRNYPGNVRDLKQLVTRIMHRHVGPGPVTVGDIPKEERPLLEASACDWGDETFERAIRRALLVGVGLKEIGRTAENTAIRIAVANENGNLPRAASKLGVTDRALQMRRATRRSQGNGAD